jgi:TPR repeat protein
MWGMIKTASPEKKDRTRPWQRAATRAAIVAAARRLIERVGVDHLSLTAVAREADFAPATVFAYFANKNDLFLSVLADDLATFARTMQQSREESDDCGEAEDSLPVVEPAPVSGPSPATLAGRLRLVEKPDGDMFDALGGTNEVASQEDIAKQLLSELAPLPVEPPGAVEAQLIPLETGPVVTTIAGELAQLKETVTRLEARPVDQWLERRLREFERGLTALEARPDKAEAAVALAAIDDVVRRLATRVGTIEARQMQAADELSRSLRERGDLVEKRLREFQSDIEAAHARTVTRIDALENAAFAVAPEFFQAGTRVSSVDHQNGAVAEPLSHESAPYVASPALQDTPAADAVAIVGDKSYLSAARRSALAAAEQDPNDVKTKRHARHLRKRTLYFIAAGLALVVVMIWTGVLFKALAVPAPQQQPQSVQQISKAVKLASKPGPQSLIMTQAQAGNAKAELVVALGLLDGPRKNEAMAAHWLTRAAQQGEAFAAFKLATLYRSGHGVPADAAQAFRWFETAAHRGNCKAMQDIAVAYAEGWGTPKDESEAARWFTHAASFGLTDAQFNLGVLYERGAGVPQSLPDAYKWYLVAAGAGDHEAEARVEAIKPQLLSSDVAAAEEAAASFKPAPLDPDANNPPRLLPSAAG